MACGNLQLCAGLEAGIEGATHVVGQRRVERVRARRGDGAQAEEEANVKSDYEGNEEVANLGLNNLRIETAIREVKAEEVLEAALRMEVEEVEGCEGEEEGGGTLRELEALEFLTQDAEPSGMTLVDSRNGFNELSRLAMLWTVRHRWTAGAKFAFN